MDICILVKRAFCAPKLVLQVAKINEYTLLYCFRIARTYIFYVPKQKNMKRKERRISAQSLLSNSQINSVFILFNICIYFLKYFT